jgi:hypothetical protein
MKKTMILLMAIALPMMMYAQSEGLLVRKAYQGTKTDQSAYKAAGAVPEENGKVIFKDMLSAPGKKKEDIYMKVAQWASFRYSANSMRGNYTDTDFFKNLEYATIKTADKQMGRIECVGAEELIFSIKPLAKNYTQAFYLLDLTIADGQVAFSLHNLAFNVDQGEGRFERVAAEDWISDKECINKKGELRRIPGKFRIKTIDLVGELKKEITEIINQ